MAKDPPRENRTTSFGSLQEQSARAVQHNARIAARTDQALLRLHAATNPTAAGGPPHQSEPDPIDSTPSEQMQRGHVVIINSDPAFLDAARVMLQAGHYNVTTTNLMPHTYQLIEAARPGVLVIDLTIEEPAIWALVEQLRDGHRTRQLPIVFTSTEDALLDRAERRPWPAGGRFLFLKPFRPQDLADVVHALAGPA